MSNNQAGFGEDMTADKFAADCAQAGLELICQEIVPWGSPDLISCFSLFRRPKAGEIVKPFRGPVTNRRFWEESRAMGRILKAYQYPSQPLVIR